jgi:hypothetical protein
VNVSENIAHKGYNVVVKSRVGNFTTGVDCFVLPKITQATPAVSFDKPTIELPSDIILADPNFNVSQEINLLIGAGLYWQLLIGGPTQLHRNQPYFQETQLGWIVSGDLKLKNSVSKFSCNLVSSERNLERQVAKIWESENVVSENDESLALETLNCENHFVKNTWRTPSGKFMLKLPFKETINLGESWTFAYRRFLSLEKRFERNHKMSNSYKEFMAEYLSLRHMELVPLKDRNSPNSFYLPHLAVYKHTAEGQKIRVVYDCSAISSNGLSLNDNLLTGGNLQGGFFDILCRFRTYKIAMSADITKMYRMIEIDPEDSNYLRILWRNNSSEPIKIYKLKPLTFGLTCAPFLAIRCLKQLASDIQENHPILSEIINRDFYMDDLLTGSDSLDEALQIKNGVTSILASAGFELCKWSASDSRLLPSISENVDSTVNFSKDNDVKVLGFFGTVVMTS